MEFIFKKLSHHEPGKGEHEPVRGELVVSENGVYENPVIEQLPVIAIGETLTFKGVISSAIFPSDGESQGVFYDDANANDFRYFRRFVTTDDGRQTVVSLHVCNYMTDECYLCITIEAYEHFYMNNPDPIIDGPGWYITDQGAEQVYAKAEQPPTFTIIAESSFGRGEDILLSLGDWFVGTSTPADGWNKVTVDVAGTGDNTVIDVDELPTENIDDSKIYRTIEE